MCSNYLLNHNWTFADRGSGVASLPRLARYHLVSFGGMLINLVILHLLAGYHGLAPMLANLAGIVVATGWSFSFSLLWTWRRPRSTVSTQYINHAAWRLSFRRPK